MFLNTPVETLAQLSSPYRPRGAFAARAAAGRARVRRGPRRAPAAALAAARAPGLRDRFSWFPAARADACDRDGASGGAASSRRGGAASSRRGGTADARRGGAAGPSWVVRSRRPTEEEKPRGRGAGAAAAVAGRDAGGGRPQAAADVARHGPLHLEAHDLTCAPTQLGDDVCCEFLQRWTTGAVLLEDGATRVRFPLGRAGRRRRPPSC